MVSEKSQEHNMKKVDVKSGRVNKNVKRKRKFELHPFLGEKILLSSKYYKIY